MKANHVLMTLVLLLASQWTWAQNWESGTQKTNSFYNYSSGNARYSKTEVWYDISTESDGKMEFGTTPLGAVAVDGIGLYAVVDDELIWVTGGGESLVAEDIAAGSYRVRITGRPTDKNGHGGNFVASYVLIPAEYVNDPEPNDTWERAYGIKSGNLQKGHLGYKRGKYTDLQDWYKIEVPDEGTLTFTTHTTTKLRLGSLNVYMMSEDGTDMKYRCSKDMDGYNKDTTIVYVVPDVAPGIYYIRLDRWNGYGSYEMRCTFTANSYKPDAAGNDTWDKALTLPFDTPIEGRLGYSYRETDLLDWYVIDVKEEGKLTFTTKTDVTLRLGSLNMYTLDRESNDTRYRNSKDMDGFNKDTMIVYEVPDVSIGKYYIRLDRWGGYGGYELTCYFTGHAAEADQEPNNEWKDALTLKSGPAVTGQLGYNYNNSTDLQDWYKIEVPKEGTVVLSTTTETTLRLGSLSIYSLNEQGTDTKFRNSKDMDGYSKDTTIVYTIPDMAPGTYYLRLDRWGGYGTYKLQYVHNPNAHENDPEPNDEWAQASLIESETTQEGCLGYRFRDYTDLQDWYKIVVPDEGAITFATTTETSLRLGSLNVYRLSDDGTDMKFRCSKDMDGFSKDTTIVYVVPDVAPGTYYIRLDRWGGYGGYKMEYTFTANRHEAEVAENDAWDKGTLIENNTTQQGRLGYSYNNTDIQDWYKIELDDEGSVTFKATTDVTLRLGSLNIYVPKKDNTSVTFRCSKDMDGNSKDTTVVYTIPDMAPGIYYIRLDRWGGYGGYDLQYIFTPSIYGADVAQNDSAQGATTIEAGSTQQGRLGYTYQDTDMRDWYRIDAPYVGNIVLSLSTETTLRAGSLTLYRPDGKDMKYITNKDMDGYNKDTTIVYNLNGRGAGTYYICLERWGGYGGYTLKYDFERNPFDRDNLQNSTFANRTPLEEGKTLSTTLGYAYTEQNSEDWYDLGMLHGRQIDVTICPDTSLTLVIGVVTLYKYKGDNGNGSPILENVVSERLERSQGTISYIDKDAEDSHYVICVPNYGSSYGGYTITFEGNEQEGIADLASANVKVMSEGRNTVRKGVPCENPITISNMSDQPSGEFLLAINVSENVNIIGFRMNGRHGTEYLPIDSVTIMDGGECEHTALFLVPNLDPWESYTFTMISEGEGDIAYANTRKEFHNGTNRIIITGTTFAVVTALGYVADAVIGEKIQDFITDQIADFFELNEDEANELAKYKKVTVDELNIQKKESGIVVYTAKAVVKKWLERVISVFPYGKIAVRSENILESLVDILPAVRRRVSLWMYRGYEYVSTKLDIIDGKAIITDVVASWDPNEMVGPQGVGDEHYIGETKTMNYRILFENKAEAGDAAYRVRVSDELDENVFDVSSVRFGETSHDGVGYNWEMKRDGNKLTWDIKGIELPPNINAPEGEGYVSFSVDLKPNLANGTKISNQATIIFDKNFPIETNVFTNTLDLVPPTTTMSTASFNATTDTINVVCSSEDAGSGVDSYLFFVSKNGEDYTYCGQSVTGSIGYPVTIGPDEDVYSFYVLASDNVGNIERMIPQAISFNTDIKAIRIVNDPNARLKVYTTDGRYVGDTISGLPKGIYIIGGKKVSIK